MSYTLLPVTSGHHLRQMKNGGTVIRAWLPTQAGWLAYEAYLFTLKPVHVERGSGGTPESYPALVTSTYASFGGDPPYMGFEHQFTNPGDVLEYQQLRGAPAASDNA